MAMTPAAFRGPYDNATNFQLRFQNVSDATVRSRILLSIMMAYGRIKTAEGGSYMEWVVHMRAPRPTGLGRNGIPEYGQANSKQTAKLPWASYHYGLTLLRQDLQLNKGKQKFIDIMNDAVKEVETSFKRFPEYMYQDGDNPITNDPQPLAGFYTWLGKYAVSTAAANQGYQNKVRLCTGTYAGLTMDLGTYGSEWKGSNNLSYVDAAAFASDPTLVVDNKWWPFGQGDAAYDFWHPLVIKCRSSAWGSNPGFTEEHCDKIIEFGVRFSHRTGQGNNGGINCIIASTSPMLTITNRFASAQRTMTIAVPNAPSPGSPGPGAYSGDGIRVSRPVYEVSGCTIFDDYDMPNQTDMIGFNFENVSYQPAPPYEQQPSSAVPLMEPHMSPIPGGGGQLIGGFNLGQMQTDLPRNWVLWGGTLE